MEGGSKIVPIGYVQQSIYVYNRTERPCFDIGNQTDFQNYYPENTFRDPFIGIETRNVKSSWTQKGVTNVWKVKNIHK